MSVLRPKSKLLALIFIVFSLLLLAATASAAGPTVVVRPGALNGWGFLEETPTGSGELVAGPATPPIGSGSARLIVNGTGGEMLGLNAYQGTRLDEITRLAYSTYQSPASGGGSLLAVALQFNIDNDLTDSDNGWKGRLVFEPYYTWPVSKGIWQTWDPRAGKWWGTGLPIKTTCPQSNPCTWSQLLSRYPNIGIHKVYGAVLFKAGSGWTGGFDGNVDAFTIGVGGAETTYDFELGDTTPPVITPNVSGTLGTNDWYVSDVTLSWNVNDPESPITSESGCDTTVVNADTAGVTFTCTATSAGGTASQSVTVKRDATPPTVTATIDPPPNLAGWNNTTPVVAHFQATDAGSGVVDSFFDVFFDTEGAGQTASWTATDAAGNSATRSVTVNIDKTAPEAYNQFDPATKDILVYARDDGSGVPSGPLAPASVVPAKWGKDDDDGEGGDDKGNAELRSYRITDAAGNSLILVEKVKKAGKEIKARVVSLQYNGGLVIAVPKNKKNFEWSTNKDGSLNELNQQLGIGSGKDEQDVEAKFESKKNETTIKVDNPKPETKVVKPGLVLLRLATDKGKLVIEY